MPCNDGITNSVCDLMSEVGQGLGMFMSNISAGFFALMIILATFLVVTGMLFFIVRLISKARHRW